VTLETYPDIQASRSKNVQNSILVINDFERGPQGKEYYATI